MFGRKRRSALGRVENLARTAQATVGMALMQHYGVDGNGSARGQGDLVTKAAAAANFLNGNSQHPGHTDVNLPQVQAEARDWLRKNTAMRELVVQTLRVTAVVHNAA